MTPQEVVDDLGGKCSAILASESAQMFSREQVVDLMQRASMKGFQLGSNVAMAIVQGAVFTKLASLKKTRK